MLSRWTFNTASADGVEGVVVGGVDVPDVADVGRQAHRRSSHFRRGRRSVRAGGAPPRRRTPRPAPRDPAGGCRGTGDRRGAAAGRRGVGDRNRVVRGRIERIVNRRGSSARPGHGKRRPRADPAVGEDGVVVREQPRERDRRGSAASRSRVAGASTSQKMTMRSGSRRAATAPSSHGVEDADAAGLHQHVRVGGLREAPRSRPSPWRDRPPPWPRADPRCRGGAGARRRPVRKT